MIQTQEIQPITQDLIKELRDRGNHLDALKVLEVFREDVKKTGKQAVSNIYKVDRRIKTHFGFCQHISCKNKAKKGFVHCESCIKSKLNSYKNRAERKKND